MNGLNFFSWIRDGVRQSVLLGVSDAVEQLGAPPSSDEIHPSVAGILAPTVNSNTSTPAQLRTNGPTNSASSGGGNRKRLGRSLKEMNAPKPD